MTPDAKFVERFQRKLRLGEDGHIIYVGAARVEIPWRIRSRGIRRMGPRRIAWIIAFGLVPDGMEVTSTASCGVDDCVALDHLEVVSKAASARRGAHPPGELHVLAQLTEPEVRRIRAVPRKPASGTLLRLATQLGVSYDYVMWLRSPVGRARCWKDVA